MESSQNNPQPTEPNNNQVQIQIKSTDEKLKGEYANFLQISRNKEEFSLDFIDIAPTNTIFPNIGFLKQRIIVSPGHLKRIAVLMNNIVKSYEAEFGTVTPSEEPKNTIGFQAGE